MDSFERRGRRVVDSRCLRFPADVALHESIVDLFAKNAFCAVSVAMDVDRCINLRMLRGSGGGKTAWVVGAAILLALSVPLAKFPDGQRVVGSRRNAHAAGGDNQRDGISMELMNTIRSAMTIWTFQQMRHWPER